MAVLCNYMRVLNPVKCVICGHETYDGMVEKHDFHKISENTFKAILYTGCPECNSTDCFKLINGIT